jgi:hypothetical protein
LGYYQGDSSKGNHPMYKLFVTKYSLFKVALIGGFIYCITGCSPTAAVYPTLETATLSLSPTEGDETEMTPPPSIPTNPGLQSLIEKAKQDLAQRLAGSANDIVLLEAASVTWPDASLGCPQEGMMYAQVLTPGYLIRLKSGEQEFEYHTGRETTVIYCENPFPPVPGVPDNT